MTHRVSAFAGRTPPCAAAAPRSVPYFGVSNTGGGVDVAAAGRFHALLAVAPLAHWALPAASTSSTASISFHPGTAAVSRYSFTRLVRGGSAGGMNNVMFATAPAIWAGAGSFRRHASTSVPSAVKTVTRITVPGPEF